MIFWVNEPSQPAGAPATLAAPANSEHQRRKWKIYAQGLSPNVLLIAALAAWTLFEAARLAFSSTHPRPNLPLNDHLVVDSVMPWELARFCLANGSRLTEVSGRPVSNADDLSSAAAPDEEGRIRLKFTAPGESEDGIDVTWMELPTYPAFTIGSDARLLAAPGLDQEDAGSFIRSMNNRALRTQAEVDEALARVGGRNPSFLLERENGTDFILAYTVIDWSAQFMILLSGIAIGVCASIVLVLRSGFTGARAFFWFSANLTLFAIARSIPYYYRSELEQWVYLLSQLSLPATATVFLFNLSPLRNIAARPVSFRGAVVVVMLSFMPALVAQRGVMASPLPDLHDEAWPVFLWLLGAPAILAYAIDIAWRYSFRVQIGGYLCFGLGISLALGLGAWWFVPFELSVGILPYGIFFAWGFWMVTIVVAGLGSELPLKLLRIPISPLDKQRAHLLRLACFCSFLPTTVYTLVEFSMFRDAVRPRFLIELAQIAFPALLAIGVVRQNVLDLPRLVRESIAAIGVVAAGIIGYGIVWAIVMPLVPDKSEVAFALYSAVYTGLLVALLASLQFLLARYADKGRFFGRGSEEDFMVRLHDVSSKVGSVNDVYDFIVNEFGDSLGVSTLHLALNAYELSGDTTNGSPNDETEIWTPELKAAAELFRHLGGQKEIFFVTDLEERSSYASPEILDALHQLGVTAGLPLRDGDQFVGALLLGKKQNNRNFSIAETGFLSRVARRLGVSLKSVSSRGMRHPIRIVDSFPAHPKEIAGFSIVRTLGQGGTSFVYLGSKNRLLAAVKVANHSVQANAILRSRFEREAELLDKLQHINVVRMIEHGCTGNEPYIALEYLQDGSLRECLERSGPLDELGVARVVDQTAAALEFALSKRIIHRDVKPGNLYLASSGVLKLADFGVGRYEDDDLFTLTGERLGTLAYMAPEALTGTDQTWKSDQYALGISAFELLVGHRPFEERSLGAQIASKRASPSSLARMLSSYAGRGFCAVILTMISPKPEDRFDRYDELRAHLLNAFGTALESPDAARFHSESELGVSD